LPKLGTIILTQRAVFEVGFKPTGKKSCPSNVGV
jgi:hypothetical protein